MADLIIVGGGLSGCLTALKLSTAKPDLQIELLESGDLLAGQATWVFREDEVNSDSLTWLKPAILNSWKEHQVLFPGSDTMSPKSLIAIRSEDLRRAVQDQLKGRGRVRLKTFVTKITEKFVVLDGGEVVEAKSGVLDCTGHQGPAHWSFHGYRKWMGFDYRLKSPHGLTTPVLIDACCPQLDGLRYYQVLPIDEKKVCVREVYYSMNKDLSRDRISRSTAAYIERKGWEIQATEREEVGCLVIPFNSGPRTLGTAGDALILGSKAGFFQSLTGSSIGACVHVAEMLAEQADLTPSVVRPAISKYHRAWLSKQKFYRLLNRYLFFATEPLIRYRFLQMLLELPDDLSSRIQTGRVWYRDRLRVHLTRKPILMKKALRHWREKTFVPRDRPVP